jgi:hypothetical protein
MSGWKDTSDEFMVEDAAREWGRCEVAAAAV